VKIGNKTYSDRCYAHIECPNAKNVFRSKCPRFSDFGKEVRRSFDVHEFCYDCIRFVEGCKGWPARCTFACKKQKRYKRIRAGVK